MCQSDIFGKSSFHETSCRQVQSHSLQFPMLLLNFANFSSKSRENLLNDQFLLRFWPWLTSFVRRQTFLWCCFYPRWLSHIPFHPKSPNIGITKNSLALILWPPHYLTVTFHIFLWVSFQCT